MTCSVTAPGWAQDIDDRKQRVERQIDQTEEHLDHTSARLASATEGLNKAVAALGTARATLARTRGELAVAQALDSRMQDELEAAVVELRRARKALAKSRVRVADQEDVLRKIAVVQYSSGDPALWAVSMVMNSQDTTQLTSQLNSVRSVLDKEAVTLDRLEASRVMLTVQETAVATAKREVAQKRVAAAENLEHKALLESRAEEARARIGDLVAVRSRAQEEATDARTEDLRQLRALEQEREQISALLKRRAEEARRQAEAEARARAEAAARARAAAEQAAAAEAEARRKARAEESARKSGPPPAAKEPAKEATKSEAPRRRAPAPVEEGMIYPVDGYITSSYGMRLHPVYKRWTLHDGTDFGAACGTPIRAAASGTVVGRYYNAGYGNRVIMDHGLERGVGLGTAYNHLSSYSTYVGQKVQRGDVIGYVGTTGYSTGCHLHFMVFEDGATVDPMTWL